MMFEKSILILLLTIAITQASNEKTKHVFTSGRVTFLENENQGFKIGDDNNKESYKQFKFEHDLKNNGFKFDDEKYRIRPEFNFGDSYPQNAINNKTAGNSVVFQENIQQINEYNKSLDEIQKKLVISNGINQEPNMNQLQIKQKRRKRKLRQKFQMQNYGYGVSQGYDHGIPLYPDYPVNGRPPYYHHQSRAEEAISSISAAFTSIARYDDFQCVPRLLCEVASGRSGGSQSGVLDKFVDLQPLVTLIAAYSGLHTSPAFFFGRAIFLGMSSKGKSNICYEAYPLCPSDPDQLVHYLNNHNGGFFRFFNNPQNYQQQGLQQFLGHLSDIPHSYGLHQPGFSGATQNYGLLNNGPQNSGLQQISQTSFGFQTGLANQFQNYAVGGNFNSAANIQNELPDFSFQNNQPYTNQNNLQKQYLYQKRYGYGYTKQNALVKNSKSEDETNKIQRRILTKPSFTDDLRTNDKAAWIFPEGSGTAKEFNYPNDTTNRGTKRTKGFNFPETPSNRQYIDYYNYPPLIDYQSKLPNYEVVENVEEDAENADHSNKYTQGNNDVELVYVIRGNGDPFNPEVVKLRPGQKIRK